jgi:hypothetical protein
MAGLVALALLTPALARKWEAGGLRFEADVLAYDGKDVTFKMLGIGTKSNFKVPVARLAQGDQQYLKATYPNGLADTSKKEEKPAEKPADAPSGETPMPDAPAAETPDPAAAAKAKLAARAATKSPTRSAPPSGKPGGVSVELVSMTVTKPPKNDAQAGLLTPGTHFTLLLSDPARTITGLDSEKSKITACIDDRKTNLAKPAEGEDAAPGMLMLEVQPGGNSGTIELAQPQVPDPKATKILIRGELFVICGEGDAAETVKVPVNIIFGLGL